MCTMTAEGAALFYPRFLFLAMFTMFTILPTASLYK